MAILKGFPPSNTISPGTRISDKDLAAPAKPRLGDKNPWMRRQKERNARQPTAMIRTRMIQPDEGLLKAMKAASEAEFNRQRGLTESQRKAESRASIEAIARAYPLM